MKTCNKCKVPKEEAEFGPWSYSKDGLQRYCRLCGAAYKREEYLRNPEKFKARQKQWVKNNPEYDQEFRAKNPDWYRLYERERWLADPDYKIRKLLRSRLKSAIKNGAKRGSALTLLGCPVWHLRAHFEFLFRPGMTWENHGPVWHIDHIKPCAAFDLTDPDQQKLCFHWTNLQPLFALENIKKSDSYHG